MSDFIQDYMPYMLGAILLLVTLIVAWPPRRRHLGAHQRFSRDMAENAERNRNASRRAAADAINASYGVSSSELERPFEIARKNVEKHPPVEAPFHPRPFSDPTIKGSLLLTRRDLEHINIQRRLKGRPPMNMYGFQRAVANKSLEDNSSSAWFTYLILYETMGLSDTSSRTSVDANLRIDPACPYNGQGGAFAGAGATGDWGTGGDPAPALLDPAPSQTIIMPDNYVPPAQPPVVADPEPRWPSDPTPAPSYTAPDPSPSPSYDSSSSSCDSGSSSSGGDAGGGGGGD